MKYFFLSFMESQLNTNFISYFFSFINEMCEGDYTNNFTTDEIFPKRDEVDSMGLRDNF